MDKRCAFVVLLGLFCLASAKLKIKDLVVPKSIKSGSQESITLDCDFEAENEKGLEIKWYRDDNDNYIYLWLPQANKPPQALGEFKDILDVKYKVSNDSSTMYRALHIMKVSPEVSGTYKCKVSSDQNEVIDAKQLIVYEPATDIELLLLPEAENVTIVCSAYGLTPEPDMVISIEGSNDTLEVEKDLKERDGVYNISTVYYSNDVETPTKFECHLTIPGTDYHIVRTEMFYPEHEEEVTDYPSTTEAYVTNSAYFNETDTTESSDIDETADEAENDDDYRYTVITEVSGAHYSHLSLSVLLLPLLSLLINK